MNGSGIFKKLDRNVAKNAAISKNGVKDSHFLITAIGFSDRPRTDFCVCLYIIPWSSIAAATFMNPAMFAPLT